MGDGRFNLLSSTGSGRPILCLNAHSDTMPPSGNSVPKSSLAPGMVRGLGSCDDKASITSMLMAFQRLIDEDLEGRLDLLISVDEEVSSRGVRTCIEGGYGCDFAIVGEPTGLAPVIAHSGLVFLDIVATGSGGHGSSPWCGKNAIEAMIILYEGLDDFISCFPTHDLVGSPSTNLGVISGGDAYNRIPDRCEAKVDVRIMPGTPMEEALNQIGNLIGRVGASHKVYKKGDPMETGEGSKLLEAVMSAQTKVLGSKIEPEGFRGWTEADPFRNLANADTLVLGPGQVEQAHSPDEYVELVQVKQASEIFFDVACELLGVSCP